RGRSSSDSHDSGAVYRGPARKSAPRAADWLVGGAPPMEGHTASPQVRFVLAREHEQRLAAHRQVHASTGANQPVDLDPPGSPLRRGGPAGGRSAGRAGGSEASRDGAAGKALRTATGGDAGDAAGGARAGGGCTGAGGGGTEGGTASGRAGRKSSGST